MDEDIAEFWSEWYNADELERLKKVEKLLKLHECVLCKATLPMVAKLINSYLEDLVEWYSSTSFTGGAGGAED